VAEALLRAEGRLREGGVPSPEADAELLAAWALGTDRAGLAAGLRDPMPHAAAERLAEVVGRRARREPVQHLVGEWEFLGYALRTDARALIPRPETEELAEAVLARLPSGRPLLLADVGTGSGCLAIALALRLPKARVIALDLSEEALSLARENRDRHGLAGRVELLRSDLLEALRPEPRLDAIVSNPPYVAEDEHEGLPPEVREHEPRLALTSGAEGLDATRRLVAGAPARLRPGGLIALECAFTRAEPVRRQLEEGGFEQVELLDDLAGVPRLALARRIGRQGSPQEAR
jgi:release factor glutamine methyltransferase